jgi:poly(3-hydroxybutyrate) depolymerase
MNALLPTRTRIRSLLATAVVALVGVAVSAPRSHVTAASPASDAALAQFVGAASAGEADKVRDAVLKAGATFDEAWAALKRGRTYKADVPKGVTKLSHRVGATEFPYTVDVPPAYDPAKKYQMRVQLHGGVGRPDATPRGNGIGALAGSTEQIYLMPTSWSEAEWWTDAQLDNLRALVDTAKRTYNVDENRVVLSGVSDGGTATYYFSMRDTTPFAAFLPLNGAIPVLRNRSMRVDGELFMHNMVNKPFFIVNGGLDPLYPISLVEPYVKQMQAGGGVVTWLPQPEAVHNTAWWPELKEQYEAFVRDHPRTPYPDKLTWESDLRAGTGRSHWLVIDELAPYRKDEAEMPDINERVGAPEPDFGIRVSGSRITSVAAGSNADSFGLVPGDVVTRIGERVVPAGMDPRDLLGLFEPGSALTLVVTRGTETRDLKGTYNPVATPRRIPFFVHGKPSGRVDLVRTGNTVTARTRRVAAFTLLLSPEQFDFAKPITIVADGKTVFEGMVKKDLATLLEWAAKDNDRTMLFAAKLPIRLGAN